MRTQGESKVSSCCFCVWCKSRELGGRRSPRFPCVTPVPESFSSDLLRATLRSPINGPRAYFFLKPPPPPPVLLGPPPPPINFLIFMSRSKKKFEKCKTYLSIRNSIKSNEIDFSECFRFQCYF